ncbi:MAG: sulfurtransferase TusA family protein [Alsobacter sp.]
MGAESVRIVRSLDLRGLKCPLPALRTRKALAGLAPGERLEVSATDALAAIDIPHLLRQTGDHLERSEQADGVLRFLIRKA